MHKCLFECTVVDSAVYVSIVTNSPLHMICLPISFVTCVSVVCIVSRYSTVCVHSVSVVLLTYVSVVLCVLVVCLLLTDVFRPTVRIFCFRPSYKSFFVRVSSVPAIFSASACVPRGPCFVN